MIILKIQISLEIVDTNNPKRDVVTGRHFLIWNSRQFRPEFDPRWCLLLTLAHLLQFPEGH